MPAAPPERAPHAILAAILVASVICLSGCQSDVGKGWYRTDGAAPSADEVSLSQTICQGEVQKANLTSSTGFSVKRSFEERDAFTGCMAGRGLILREIR